ncbi:hypothetical protein TeGR_g3022 [Tetraparma gracilis]|uniref:Uncharacterized protein n=1 Tax=Tetraparma gracilis TaxID=2962635 RepID=A0ABQ6N6D6_9STRA|nr:hypothetical protein TeGR_g3022 [Tetraparma gracilis]
MSALVSPPACSPASIPTAHTDMIHDSKLDYYGTLLATCSSDASVRVFELQQGAQSAQPMATLSGHSGPVWCVDWSHPRFGVLLASCSFDGSLLLHREVSPGKYALIHKHTSAGETASGSSSSINHVAFGPPEGGLSLACVSASGAVSVLTHSPDDTWATATFQACPLGVNSVAWAPHADGKPPRLCTGGCDSRVQLWSLGEQGWAEDRLLGNGGHGDWVRDVAWSPASSPGNDLIASVSEDGTVLLWSNKEGGDVYNPTLMHQFPDPCYRASWSVTGNVLAISSGESDVSLWKKQVTGEWTRVADVDDPQQQMQPVGEEGAM